LFCLDKRKWIHAFAYELCVLREEKGKEEKGEYRGSLPPTPASQHRILTIGKLSKRSNALDLCGNFVKINMLKPAFPL
jgi:hypothetical protein